MISCPNKSHPDFNKFVNKYGEKKAYLVWNNLYNENIVSTTLDTVQYNLKSLDILSSDKATQVFAKGNKNGWNLNKILTELAIPKDQKQLILDKNITNKDEIITFLLADNSFAVEVNTIKKSDNFENNYDEQEQELLEAIDNPILSEELRRESEQELNTLRNNTTDLSKNTSYYINLTVPGGTNYTENEIATPAITPNIKGHAQFSTDNGIGWFRSDDQSGITDNKKGYEFKLNTDTYNFSFNNKTGEDTYLKNSKLISKKEYNNALKSSNTTKTRRILEVQSDLFQKGRDNKDLVNTKVDPTKPDPIKSNQFLQLLNKKGNWVNFFIQSIVQDSVKKGYEKVLFPTGETAAKIEGHQTIADEITNINDRIKNLKAIPNPYEGLVNKPVETDAFLQFVVTQEDYDNEKKNREKKIQELESQKQEMKTQGLEKLKPVEAFYTNRVTNILNKLYDVTEITDENNNTWNEVDLTSQKKDFTNIFLNASTTNFNKKKFTEDPKELTKTKLKSLMSIPSGNVSLQQTINAKENIKKFNGMFGTSHSLETTKVGESLSYNINFIVNTAPRNEKAFQERQKSRLNPDKFSQGLLFTKESPQKEASNKRQQIIDKTNKRLSKIMTSLGIDVQQQRSLFTEYGNGINGVADLLNKVIKVTDKKYLPEEASHFIMAMLDSSPYKKGLLNLARQSKMYAEVQEEYMRLYNQDENKVAEEVAGKLLAQSFINVEAESLNKENPTLKRRLATLADIIWNWLQKTFSPSIRNEITNIYNELAEQVYAGKINLNPANLLNGGKFFNAESTRNMNKTKVSQGILKKSIARIQNEINILKKQVSKSSLTTNVGYQEKVNLLASLQVKLHDKQYVDGIYNFLNTIKEDMLGTSTPDIESMGSFLDKIGNLNKQIQDGTITNNNAAKQIKELHDHFSSYSPVLKLINSSFNDKTFLKELADADLSPEDINKMKIEVNTLQGQIESLRSDYLAMSKKILTSQYLTYSKQSKEDFVFDEDGNLKFLSLAFKDENGYTRWLTAMAESHDAGLRITDKIVKTTKDAARLKTLDESKDILNEFDRLSAKGLKLNIIETEKGTPTGYYISDRHRGKFMTAFNKQLAKTKEMKEAGMDSYSIGQEWGTWKQANGTFENPDAGKYTNPAWAKLSGEQQKYLTMLREERSKKLDSLPTGSRSYWMVPQFRKDLVERVRSSNISGAVKVIKDSLLDALVIREDATEFGQVYKDILGKEINFLPLYGNSMLEELGDLSDDITSTTITYNSFATDHIEMQKIIHTIEIAKDVYKERDVLTGNVSEEDYKNLDMEDLLQKYSHTSGEVSKSFERFSTYSEMQVYGKYKESSTFKFFGKDVSVTKVFDVLAKYTALNTLAANIYPIINNVVLGRSLEFMEGIVGEYFDNKHLYSADKKLLNPKIIGDIGKKVAKTKVMVYGEYMNVLQDHEQVITDINTDRKTRIGQIFKNSPWFAGSHMGEFNIQMRASIAFAESISLIDSKGKKTNLYDAFTVKDGKMSLNGKFKVAEANRLFSEKRVGTFINQGDITDFIFQQNNLNQKLHGIYNKLDRNSFQQKASGGLVMLFRKFLIPAIQRRYKLKRFNEMSGQLDEGYYQTLFKFIKMLKTDTDKAAVLFKGTFNSKNLNKEELRQIQNLRRAGLDIGFALALIVFTNLLLDDDDKSDDSWAKSMLAYQAHRLFTEISAFMPAPTIFSEGTKLLASPSAAVSQLESVSSFLNEMLNFTRYGEEIEAGQYKGYTRLGKGGTALIPGYKTVKSWFHPDEKVKYFYRN